MKNDNGRRCRIFYCDHRRGSYCCADCGRGCSHGCLNDPDRCGASESIEAYRARVAQAKREAIQKRVAARAAVAKEGEE